MLLHFGTTMAFAAQECKACLTHQHQLSNQSFFSIVHLQIEQEKAALLQHIQEIEEEHKQAVVNLQHHVQEKEKALAAEFEEAEQVYKTTEHDLREQLEEKTRIIEVK